MTSNQVTIDAQLFVSVHRHPQDWQTATYRLEKLRRRHFDTISGGVGKRTGRETIFAYVWCNEMESGELAHSCRHAPAPHEIKVAVPKVCNSKEIIGYLRNDASLDQARRKRSTG